MELLYELYHISSPSHHEGAMMGFIQTRLDILGVDHYSDPTGNIYAIKGISASYPCVVSHADEVHGPHVKDYQVRQVDNKIIFGFNYPERSFCGIGADDKNGIWICLKCLELFDVMKCVFFVSEETGCQGSLNAGMRFFDDCRFVLQCDRKGNSDMVTSYSGMALCSKDFIHDAAPGKYGYRQSGGLITDVIMLKKRKLPVSCANLSCGYYLPHTAHEFTCMEDLQKCFAFVRHIVRDCTKTYRHKAKKARQIYRQAHPFSGKYFPEWTKYQNIAWDF